jgi:hypothetical protein
MEEKPKRRWLRFSIRTMLIAVTILCIGLSWLGWQISVVRERRIVLGLARSLHAVVDQADSRSPTTDIRLSPIRSWLGDVAVFQIQLLEKEGSAEERETIIRSFPEAKIRWIPGRMQDGVWVDRR